jgi:hypothetical protein
VGSICRKAAGAAGRESVKKAPGPTQRALRAQTGERPTPHRRRRHLHRRCTQVEEMSTDVDSEPNESRTESSAYETGERIALPSEFFLRFRVP